MAYKFNKNKTGLIKLRGKFPDSLPLYQIIPSFFFKCFLKVWLSQHPEIFLKHNFYTKGIFQICRACVIFYKEKGNTLVVLKDRIYPVSNTAFPPKLVPLRYVEAPIPSRKVGKEKGCSSSPFFPPHTVLMRLGTILSCHHWHNNLIGIP